jgi:hypothetical protein
MKRTWTIIRVNDVHASMRWYQFLFGQAETAPAQAAPTSSRPLPTAVSVRLTRS